MSEIDFEPTVPPDAADGDASAVLSERQIRVAGELPAEPLDPLIGRVLDGRYQVEAVLGQGGMGVVYRGRHKVIDKKVAIKVLRGEMARDHEVTERFLQEAKAASSIGNQHIIDISDFGALPDGATYFVMEFLDGKSLSALHEEVKPLPVPRIVAIAKQIAQGLSAAHAAGIVHRDLKPDNIMLVARGGSKDFVKILDFGIAKVGSGQTNRLTRAGSIFGTPHYMSPEQAAGAAVNHATDIYSLGIILYELAAGKVPFDAENFMGILTMHMYKAPPPMRALVPQPDVPPGLDAIVLKCLSKKPESRYASMDELVVDLEKFEAGGMPDAVNEMMARSGGFNVPADYFRSSMPQPVPGSPRRGSRRWPLYAGLAGVGAAVLIVVGIFASSASVGAQSQPSHAQAEATVAASVKVPDVAPPAGSSTAAPRNAVPVSIEPPDAVATVDGAPQKTNPFVLHIPAGESAQVVVARAGYATQTVTVLASEPSRIVRLVAQPAASGVAGKPLATGAPPATVTRPPPTGTKPSGGSLSLEKDPWK
jgi:serine/threonine-protein kinase